MTGLLYFLQIFELILLNVAPIILLPIIIGVFFIQTKSYFTILYEKKYGSPSTEQSKEVRHFYVEQEVKGKLVEIAISASLGFFAAFGVNLLDTCLCQLGMFMVSLSFYHFLEYSFSHIFHFEKTDKDSFLINQSKQYGIAMAAAFVEYFIEFCLFDFKLTHANNQDEGRGIGQTIIL